MLRYGPGANSSGSIFANPVDDRTTDLVRAWERTAGEGDRRLILDDDDNSDMGLEATRRSSCIAVWGERGTLSRRSDRSGDGNGGTSIKYGLMGLPGEIRGGSSMRACLSRDDLNPAVDGGSLSPTIESVRNPSPAALPASAGLSMPKSGPSISPHKLGCI